MSHNQTMSKRVPNSTGGSNASVQLDWSLLLLVLYGACIYAVQPAFFSPNNLWALLYYTCLLVPAVLGVHILIILGLFDLSVGAVASFPHDFPWVHS